MTIRTHADAAAGGDVGQLGRGDLRDCGRRCEVDGGRPGSLADLNRVARHGVNQPVHPVLALGRRRRRRRRRGSGAGRIRGSGFCIVGSATRGDGQRGGAGERHDRQSGQSGVVEIVTDIEDPFQLTAAISRPALATIFTTGGAAECRPAPDYERALCIRSRAARRRLNESRLVLMVAVQPPREVEMVARAPHRRVRGRFDRR